MTGVYGPKPFIPHAASLHQAFAHCEKFSTAATRRCLDRVSVPVWLVVLDRKSTRLNSSHLVISYAVFCLKKEQQHHRSFHDTAAHSTPTRTLRHISR